MLALTYNAEKANENNDKGNLIIDLLIDFNRITSGMLSVFISLSLNLVLCRMPYNIINFIEEGWTPPEV